MNEYKDYSTKKIETLFTKLASVIEKTQSIDVLTEDFLNLENMLNQYFICCYFLLGLTLTSIISIVTWRRYRAIQTASKCRSPKTPRSADLKAKWRPKKLLTLPAELIGRSASCT